MFHIYFTSHHSLSSLTRTTAVLVTSPCCFSFPFFQTSQLLPAFLFLHVSTSIAKHSSVFTCFYLLTLWLQWKPHDLFMLMDFPCKQPDPSFFPQSALILDAAQWSQSAQLTCLSHGTVGCYLSAGAKTPSLYLQCCSRTKWNTCAVGFVLWLIPV